MARKLLNRPCGIFRMCVHGSACSCCGRLQNVEQEQRSFFGLHTSKHPIFCVFNAAVLPTAAKSVMAAQALYVSLYKPLY